MDVTFRNARLVDAAGGLSETDITIGAGRILSLGRPGAGRGATVDLGGMLVTPGFIDVHTHGGGGHALHTKDTGEIRAYARWAPTTGATAFLIGVLGVPGGLPEEQLQAAIDAIEAPGPGAAALGIHLEGPYISPGRRGAHDASWLRMPSASETARLLALAGRRLKIVTLAPELPGAGELIHALTGAGVTVSIGHTDATYEEAHNAIQMGVSHATHVPNAMPRLHHREPGALGAVLESGAVRCELIADGVHVHPAMMKLLIAALGPERVVAITDALPAAGTDRAFTLLGGRHVSVQGGAARLDDGALAGSLLTTDAALHNLLRLAGSPLPAAVGMLTRNPARAAGVGERKGMLIPGYDADLLVFDASLTLQVTLCRGTVAYATAAWRERLEALG